MTSLLKRKPYWVYYFWCCLIPSVIVASLMYFPAPFYWLHGGAFDFMSLMQTTIAKSGVKLRDGALIPMLRATRTEGILVFVILCSAIPAVVALILAPLTFGKQGLVTLLSRLRPWGKSVGPKEGFQIWGAAVVTIIGTNLFAFLLLHLFARNPSETISWNQRLLSFAAFWIILEAMFTNQGGLLEELGWRGYALPLLLEKMNPLRATLLLGFCWAMWHIPRDIFFHYPEHYGMPMYLFAYLPMFTSWCIGGSILMTYFFNRTGGSALAGIAIHGLLNDSAGITGKLIGGDEIHSMLPRTIAVVVAGVITVIVAGPTLGLRPK
jgi:membrane protease YdiL (CAAX protease family)